jgi:phosphatidylglycerophosphate synthase
MLVDRFLPGRLGELHRVNDGFLQPIERPVLQWLVRRVPARVSSDDLTRLGLIGAALALAAFLLSRVSEYFLLFACLGIAINWLGDSLDGTLARFRQRPRHRYGIFIDHVTDLFAQILIGIGLAASGLVRFEAAAMALLAYLAFDAFTMIRERATGVFQITFLGIGPTEVRCALIGLTLFLLFGPSGPVLQLWAPLSLADLALIGTAVMSLIGLALFAIAVGRRLGTEDP